VAIDLVAVALLAVAAASGSLSGALHQVVHLSGMVVGWLAARHLGPPIARGLARWLPQTAARGAAGVLLFLGFSILAAWIGHRLLATRRVAAAVRSPPDRGLGALLGGAKAALTLWIALSALALVGGRVSLGRFALDGAGSDLAALAHRHNLLTTWSPVTGKALERLVSDLRDPKERRRLADDPGVRRLRSDPRLRALLDGAPGRSPDSPDREELERARKALEVLDDPEVRALLERLAAEPARGSPPPVPEGGQRAR
jgi:membrane protein required for colicin V production